MSANSLTAWLERVADSAGATPAVIYQGREIGFGDLLARSRRVARGLADLGVAAGDRVAVWLPNTPAWLEVFFACAQLGAIVVAVNTRFRAAEVEDIVGRSGSKALVLWPGFKGIDFLGILEQVDPAALSELGTVVVYGEDDEDAAGPTIGGRIGIGYDHLLRAEPYQGDHGDADTGVLIFTTSGTTSLPKFVLHTHASLSQHVEAAAPALGYDQSDAILLQALPLCGAYGMAQALSGLAARRPMVMMQTFDAEEAAALIREHDITHMNGSDEMYRRLLDVRGGTNPFPSLCLCGFASFNSDPSEMIALGDARGLPLIGLFGMSEIQALFSARAVDEPPEIRMLSGGRPVASETVVRACDPETGAVLDHGAKGELQIKGPSLMAGYFGDPEATDAAFTGDGFFRSGDLGFTEPGGTFTFLSRMGDALRLGGYMVSPQEISSYLERHEDVSGAQVVGVKGALGQQPVAFVTVAQGATFSEDALRAHCADGMAKFKVPVRIFEIDAFPMADGANGAKVQRSKLREIATSRLAAD